MKNDTNDFLGRLSELGIRVWEEAGKIRCDAPDGVLTDEIKRELSNRKPEIISFFSAKCPHSLPDEFDPLDEQFVLDPYPCYKKLRESGGIYKSPGGHWILSKYDLVRDALVNKSLGNSPSDYSWVNSKNSDKSLCARVANNILPFMDGEEHTKCRKLIIKAFLSQKNNKNFDLQEIAIRFLKPYLAIGKVDLVVDFGRPFASEAIARLIGLPPEDHVRLARWGDLFLYLLTGAPSIEIREEVEIALNEFRVYCAYWVDERISRPEDDLITALLSIQDSGDTLTRDQVIDTLMLLVGDGIENVASAVGSCVATLLHNHETLELIYEKPEFLRRAITECLRFETPGQFIARVAKEDLVIQGNTIRKNESLLLMLASANHDPDVYANPERFDVHRDENWLLSFGRGSHSCLGAQLVPVELEVAIRVIMDFLRNLSIDNDDLEWRYRPGHRWLVKCPVTFTAV